VPLPTTHKAAESEDHAGLVHVDAARLADNELSKVPKFLPAIVISRAPKTGPLVEAMDDAVGESYSNAAVLEPTSNATEIEV